MKKFLSMFLTLALIISCFASLTVSVSAHQNKTAFSDFESIKNGTVEVSGVEGIPEIETDESGKIVGTKRNYYCGDFRFDSSANGIMGLAYMDAPANAEKYGKSLMWFVNGSKDALSYVSNTTPQLYSTVIGEPAFTGSVSVSASLYMTDRSMYRTLKVNGEGPGNNLQTIVFSNNGSVYLFGNTKLKLEKTWSANKWYDIELKFNIDTKYYEFTVYEDGEFFGKISGVYADSTYKTMTKVTFMYNNTVKAIDDANVDVKTYIDNFCIKSINKLEPAGSDDKEVFDFENFEGQIPNSSGSSVGFPQSQNGTWAIGYNGNARLLHATAEIVMADSRWEKNPAYGTSMRYQTPPVPANADDYAEGVTKNQYQYPQFSFGFSNSQPIKYNVSYDIKLDKPNLITTYLASQYCPIMSMSSTNLTVSGKVVSKALNNYDWFNVNIFVDGETGWYKVIVTNTTSPSNEPIVTEGYDKNIIERWNGTANRIYFQMNTPGTRDYECYCYLDNICFSEYFDSEVPANFTHSFDSEIPGWYTTSVADGSNLSAADGKMKIASVADADAVTSFALPFAYTNLGFEYSAELTFEDFNTAKTLSLGDVAFATVDTTGVLTMGGATTHLEAGKTYTLSVEAVNGDSASATVSLAGLEATAVPTSHIKLTAGAGESVVAIDNVEYNIVRNFEVSSDEAMIIEPTDDVVITFSNPLAETVDANAFKVYAPTGTISDDALVSDVTFAISDDRTTVTLDFAKEYTAHYHTAFTVTDVFGNELTDIVEVDTTPVAELGDVNFVTADGTVTAQFSSTANEGTIFYAIALYEGNELVAIGSKNVTLSLEDVNNDYTVSVEIPDTSKSYTAKVFRWVRNNIAPYQGAAMAESVISAE